MCNQTLASGDCNRAASAATAAAHPAYLATRLSQQGYLMENPEPDPKVSILCVNFSYLPIQSNIISQAEHFLMRLH